MSRWEKGPALSDIVQGSGLRSKGLRMPVHKRQRKKCLVAVPASSACHDLARIVFVGGATVTEWPVGNAEKRRKKTHMASIVLRKSTYEEEKTPRENLSVSCPGPRTSINDQTGKQHS